MHTVLKSAGFQHLREASRALLYREKDLFEVLVVATNWGAADDFCRSCGPAAGAAGFHRMTFIQLVSDIAIQTLAQRDLAPVTALGSQVIAARSIFASRSVAPLEYFEPVAEAPGFARALTRTLTELRMEGVEPEALSQAGPPGSDLRSLLQAFQDELAGAHLADLPGTFQMALQTIASRHYRLARLPIVLLGISPVTALERHLIRALGQQSPLVIATLLSGDSAGISALEEALGVRAVDLDQPPSDEPRTLFTVNATTRESRLDRLRRYLFSESVPAGPADADDSSLIFFSAPGEGRECIEIARHIRFAVDEGVRFDQMAILLRNPGTYLPLVEEALRRANVPGYFTRGTVRPDPAGRAFLALLECALEGLSASRFAEYLSLGQLPLADEEGAPARQAIPWVNAQDEQLCFKTLEDDNVIGDPPERNENSSEPAAPVVSGSLKTPFQWEKMLVDAAVIGGKERWKIRLAGLQNEFEVRLRSSEDESERMRTQQQLERLRYLQQFALPLIEFLDALPAEAHWELWLNRLEELAALSLKHPESVLSLLAELRPMGQVGPVTLSEVKELLSERLTFLRNDPPRNRFGRVLVATIPEASGRSLEWVFLPGLAEGVFPRKAVEDPLLLDIHREKLSIPPSLDQHRLNERLLLRTAVGVARAKLIVSYPRMDVSQGRSRVPSFYALDILRAAEGHLPNVRRLEKQAAEASQSRLGWPAPKESRLAIDEAEYDLAQLDPLLSRDAEVRKGQAQFLLRANPHLARSLRCRARRWRNFFSEADGIVDPPQEVLEVLREQRLGKRSYSPTSLQQFATCPYKFYLYSILRLRAREEAVAIEQMDPLTRGGLFHEIQFELFRELDAQNLLPITPSNRDSVQGLANEVMDRVARRYGEDLAPAIPRVWESEIESLRSDLQGWIRQAAVEGETWKPFRFELAFGLPLGPERDPSSFSRDAMTPEGFRLRGSIDLVEVNLSRKSLRVVDHKTGKAAAENNLVVKGGEILQPLVYALAAETLLEAEVEAGELFYCTQRGGYQRLSVPLNAGSRHQLKTVLEIIDDAVEKGFFPAAPREKACTFCDYQMICGPYEEMRFRRKRGDRLASITQLRKLP